MLFLKFMLEQMPQMCDNISTSLVELAIRPQASSDVWVFFINRGKKMTRYCFYIDGFNVYHALNKKKYRKYKWLNYRSLAESVIGTKDAITGIFYFSTYAEWRIDSKARHKQYILALRRFGVKMISGRFMKKETRCHLCNKVFKTHEEKRTDVNIALKLVTNAIDDIYDTAVIISADSDLIPAIDTVRKYAPDKRIGVMFPIGRSSNDIKQKVDFRLKMSERLLRETQFPDIIEVGKTKIRRPATWI